MRDMHSATIPDDQLLLFAHEPTTVGDVTVAAVAYLAEADAMISEAQNKGDYEKARDTQERQKDYLRAVHIRSGVDLLRWNHGE